MIDGKYYITKSLYIDISEYDDGLKTCNVGFHVDDAFVGSWYFGHDETMDLIDFINKEKNTVKEKSNSDEVEFLRDLIMCREFSDSTIFLDGKEKGLL